MNRNDDGPITGDRNPSSVPLRIKARLYFEHAVNDQSMPAEAIEKLGRALASWGGEYQCETYDAALSRMDDPGRARLQREASRRRFRPAHRAQTLK
jgi:dienelactone hydrolase